MHVSSQAPPIRSARATAHANASADDVLQSFSPMRMLLRWTVVAITALTIFFWLVQLDHASHELQQQQRLQHVSAFNRATALDSRHSLVSNAAPNRAAQDGASNDESDASDRRVSTTSTSDDAPTLTIADDDTSTLLLEEDAEQSPSQSFTFGSLIPESLHSQRFCRQLQSKLHVRVQRSAASTGSALANSEALLTSTLLVRDRSGHQSIRSVEAHLHASPATAPTSSAHPITCPTSTVELKSHEPGQRFAARTSVPSSSLDPLDSECDSSSPSPSPLSSSSHLQTIRLSFDMQRAHSDPSAFLLQLPSFTNQLAALPIGLTVRSHRGAICHTSSIRFHLNGNDTRLRVDDVFAEFVGDEQRLDASALGRLALRSNGGAGVDASVLAAWPTSSSSSSALGSLCAHQAVVYGAAPHWTIAFFPLTWARIRSVHALGHEMIRSSLSNSPVYITHVDQSSLRAGGPLRFGFEVTFEALAPSAIGGAGSPAHLDCSTPIYTHSTAASGSGIPAHMYPQSPSRAACRLAQYSFQLSATQVAPPPLLREELVSLADHGHGSLSGTPRLYQLTLLSDEHPLDWVMLNIHTHSNSSMGDLGDEHVDRLQMARTLGRERPRAGERRSKRQLGRRLRWDKVIPYLLQPEQLIDVQFTFSAAGATCDTVVRQFRVGQLARVGGAVKWPADGHELSRFVRAQPSGSSATMSESSATTSSMMTASLSDDAQYDDPAAANRQFTRNDDDRSHMTSVRADDAASEIDAVRTTTDVASDEPRVPGGVFAARVADRRAITPHDVGQFALGSMDEYGMEISQQPGPGPAMPDAPGATGGQPSGPPPRPERCEPDEYFCQIFRECYPCFTEPTGALCSACEPIFRCTDEACRRQKTCLWCGQLPTSSRLPVCTAIMSECAR